MFQRRRDIHFRQDFDAGKHRALETFWRGVYLLALAVDPVADADAVRKGFHMDVAGARGEGLGNG